MWCNVDKPIPCQSCASIKVLSYPRQTCICHLQCASPYHATAVVQIIRTKQHGLSAQIRLNSYQYSRLIDTFCNCSFNSFIKSVSFNNPIKDKVNEKVNYFPMRISSTRRIAIYRICGIKANRKSYRSNI